MERSRSAKRAGVSRDAFQLLGEPLVGNLGRQEPRYGRFTDT